MNIYKYTPDHKTGLQNAVIALGFFDGVHIAHRELIRKTVEIAKRELGLVLINPRLQKLLINYTKILLLKYKSTE